MTFSSTGQLFLCIRVSCLRMRSGRGSTYVFENDIKEHGDKMRMIRLKKFWAHDDRNLVQNARLTFEGTEIYWKSLDSTLQFNIKKREEFLLQEKTAMKRKSESKPANASHFTNDKDDMKNFFKRHRNDRYHWHNELPGG